MEKFCQRIWEKYPTATISFYKSYVGLAIGVCFSIQKGPNRCCIDKTFHAEVMQWDQFGEQVMSDLSRHFAEEFKNADKVC